MDEVVAEQTERTLRQGEWTVTLQTTVAPQGTIERMSLLCDGVRSVRSVSVDLDHGVVQLLRRLLLAK